MHVPASAELSEHHAGYEHVDLGFQIAGQKIVLEQNGCLPAPTASAPTASAAPTEPAPTEPAPTEPTAPTTAAACSAARGWQLRRPHRWSSFGRIARSILVVVLIVVVVVIVVVMIIDVRSIRVLIVIVAPTVPGASHE
jgi:hypothetical protein